MADRVIEVLVPGPQGRPGLPGGISQEQIDAIVAAAQAPLIAQIERLQPGGLDVAWPRNSALFLLLGAAGIPDPDLSALGEGACAFDAPVNTPVYLLTLGAWYHRDNGSDGTVLQQEFSLMLRTRWKVLEGSNDRSGTSAHC
ncbi:hypothetical protein [Salinarimonas soli]|uniref:Uncharacterized protein n=1 Tax=Salinarimonas soli TaxID=1638099 RepID=A0A5B2V9Y8_9HYPH|nr:hypothetical protein [Salinarimonas soli]KAA2235260.1 hypothetical protein F0L46_21190 [Salinarimonas soli]